MKILIVGLGYAGTRFLRAFDRSGAARALGGIETAYVDRVRKPMPNRYFPNVAAALASFRPDIVAVCVNDDAHAEILNQMAGFQGFVICEKPLTGTSHPLGPTIAALADVSGFCLDLIERYSEVTAELKAFVRHHHLRLLRAHFHWAKNRINDRRPTCGVISEVIHPIDLVQHICDPALPLRLQSVFGSRSDFSISGSDVLDSVALSAELGAAVVTGFSSFVALSRRREIELTFTDPDGSLIYAFMIFDTPVWDRDHLRIWRQTAAGEEMIVDRHTQFEPDDPGLATIRKLVRLVDDVVQHARGGPASPGTMPGLDTACSLQTTLNEISSVARTPPTVRYVQGNSRVFASDEADLERLG